MRILSALAAIKEASKNSYPLEVFVLKGSQLARGDSNRRPVRHRVAERYNAPWSRGYWLNDMDAFWAVRAAVQSFL